MKEQFSRTAILLGEDAVDSLMNKKVCLFGLGGVGGFVAEALARAGVGHFVLVDNDTVSKTNINRQIIATLDTIGMNKVDLVAKRILSINEDAIIEKKQMFYLPEVKDEFDYILIDCPPSLGILTTNALTASDSVIIPVQCEFFALEGITQLLNEIMLTKKQLNPNLKLEGVLLTMFDTRANLSIEVIEEIRSYFKDKVYTTLIPRLIRLAEAPSHGKPILIYDPKSKGTIAYMNLAKEVIERNGNDA
jgi:cellulose biosynthesis protein BcsQ